MTEIYTRLVEGLPDINVAAVGYTDNIFFVFHESVGI